MENVALNARKKITMDKYFSQVKIVTPNNITKLINVSAKSVVSSVELVNNFLLVSGKVIANAVYLSDENKIENTESVFDFVEKQKVNFVVSELSADDDVKFENISISSSEIVCSVEHKTTIFGIYRYLVIDGSKVDDDLVVKNKNIACLNFVSSNEDNFVVAEEIESNLKDIKILNVDSNVVILNCSAAVEKTIIDGKIKVNVLYLDENGLGEISKEFEFKQEIALKNAMPGLSCEVMARLTNSSISCQQKDDKYFVNFVFDLYAKAYLFDSLSVETFDDVFSLKNEIVPHYEVLEFEEDDGLMIETDTILCQTDVSKVEDFDDLVGVYQPKIENVAFTDNGERAEVVAKLNAIAVYKTASGISKLDLSYDTKFDISKDITKQLKNVKIIPSVSAFKVKAGKDLECAFFLDYKFEFEKQISFNYVKSFDTVAAKSESDAALKVYVAKNGQNVFDVAKILNVKPEVILSQNEISGDFETGQKIYVYSPLNFC